MRLLTMNAMKNPAKDAAEGYPLHLEIVDMEVDDTEANFDFLRAIMPSLNWESILIAAKTIGLDGIPDSYDAELLKDSDFLLAMHKLLIDVHVLKGFLVCPDTGRKFAIEDGIPRMIMDEKDV